MDDLRIDDQLARWSEIGTGYARSLPPSPKIEPNPKFPPSRLAEAFDQVLELLITEIT
jgi:hypothetical protein